MPIPSKWIYTSKKLDCCPKFCKFVKLSEKPVEAKAYVSSIGVYDFFVNGKKQGNAFFAPGWTSCKRVQYQEYDITESIESEKCELSILVGDGYALGDISSHHIRPNGSNHFFDHISVCATVIFKFKDGRKKIVHTDSSWEVFTSSVLYSDFYHGEIFDTTVKDEKICNAELDFSVTAKLVPQQGEIVCAHEKFEAKRLFVSPKGEKIIDFGQNLAGFVEITVPLGVEGKIVLSHAEVLDKDGNFYNENLQRAKAKIEYVLDGKTKVYAPHFTYQGFRYVRIDEYPNVEINIDNFKSVAIYSNIKRTGEFSCGNQKINRLYENILWSQKSNFIDIPTDCPQRSERLGWTGDAQVFCRSACINYNVKTFFDKWLTDMSLEQKENGAIPDVIPAVFLGKASSVWGDAAVICPWEIYLAYGDKQKLRKYYPMMKKWVKYIQIQKGVKEDNLWVGGNHYGDWLALDAGEGKLLGSTQIDLIASAFYFYSVTICQNVAKILKYYDDEKEFSLLSISIKNAFQSAFLENGKPKIYPKGDGDLNIPHNGDYDRPISNNTQTALALILRFGLCEDKDRQNLAELLARKVYSDGKLTTGFVGTPHILHALSENGYCDIAYNLLLSEKNPSWLFAVNQGATTIWEHWDSLKENGEFWDKDMNSFNHYAYGSVFDWIFGVAMGVKVKENGAGYKKFIFKPNPDKRISPAKASIETKQGKISVAWEWENDSYKYYIEIPSKTEVEVILEGKSSIVINKKGKYAF